MRRFSFFLLSLTIWATCFGSGVSNPEGESLDSHFEKFSKINQTKHDNIDDSNVEHSHSHKHTKDSDEHEHKHEHSKLVQSDFKVLFHDEQTELTVVEYESTQGFNEKYLLSNPHLLKSFRPPIS